MKTRIGCLGFLAAWALLGFAIQKSGGYANSDGGGPFAVIGLLGVVLFVVCATLDGAIAWLKLLAQRRRHEKERLAFWGRHEPGPDGVASLHVGGVMAVGFDRTGRYMLVVSHAGRGVFYLHTWERVARDETVAYPDNGIAIGIGPLHGQAIPVVELDSDTASLDTRSPDGRYRIHYEQGTIDISPVNPQS